MATAKMDIELLKREPESAFDSPIEIVSHEGLSRAQKMEVLEAWEGLCRAGMLQRGAAAGTRIQLQEIEQAKAELDRARD